MTVCTWCALQLPDRDALDAHWRENPECSRQRSVSNQLQTKYGNADLIVTQPGEDVLNRVRAKTCRHASTKALVNGQGEPFARQCMTCYSQLPLAGMGMPTFPRLRLVRP